MQWWPRFRRIWNAEEILYEDDHACFDGNRITTNGVAIIVPHTCKDSLTRFTLWGFSGHTYFVNTLSVSCVICWNWHCSHCLSRMISSHKRILLNGFGENFNNGSLENVKIVCSDGRSNFNAMVLGSIAPWLLQDLLDKDPDETTFIMPDILLEDWTTFASNLMTDKDFFHVDEVRTLRKSAASVCQLLGIDFFGKLEVPETSYDEELLDDPMSLDNSTLVENFSDQEQRLVCLVCYKIFAREEPKSKWFSSFKRHLSSHPQSALKRIQIRKHKDILYQCQRCPSTKFMDMNALQSHHNLNHGQAPLQARFCCVFCDYSNAKFTSVSCHLRSHQERKFECNICKKKFLLKQWLVLHVKKDSCKSSDRKCDHCNKTFSTSTALRLHVSKLKDSAAKFECQVCKKVFKENRSLKEHYLTHRRERSNVCSFCSKSFVQKNHLLYHLASVHNSTPDGQASKHVCKICSRSFAFPYLLKKHETAHVKRLVNHFKTAEADLNTNQLKE